jgi:fumarate hydratase subunit alpha
MREIPAELITQTVMRLFIAANTKIGQDVSAAMEEALQKEESPVGRAVLEQILCNYKIAAEEEIPICQDTGMSVLFIDLGREVHITGAALEDAVNEGVRRAYREGYLRKSVVSDPLFDRKNTGDNTPAILHLRLVEGDKIRIVAVPKGFGSENMSAVKMLKPSDGVDGVEKFVTETVANAGPNACPPVVVGVGIGGTVEQAAILSKRAVARGVGTRNESGPYAELEQRLLEQANRLGLGPGGTGGIVTALAGNVEYAPTHIAGLPVAVNICCHAARHGEAVI